GAPRHHDERRRPASALRGDQDDTDHRSKTPELQRPPSAQPRAPLPFLASADGPTAGDLLAATGELVERVQFHAAAELPRRAEKHVDQQVRVAPRALSVGLALADLDLLRVG